MENIFQRPPILMRLTMLTRGTMSLLRAASLRTAWETAHGLNDRKQRGWVEAGILPAELLPLNRQLKYRGSHLEERRQMAKMKAVQVPRAGADFEIVEREIPQPGAGHVRIQGQAWGICPSDATT